MQRRTLKSLLLVLCFMMSMAWSKASGASAIAPVAGSSVQPWHWLLRALRPPIPVSEVKSITVSPATVIIRPRAAYRFTAAATLTDGRVIDVSHQVEWHLLTSGVATGHGDGVMSGAATGITEVVARLQHKTGSATLRVDDPARLVVESPHGTMAPATERKLRAYAYYADGTSADVTHQTVWSTSDANVATVSPTGTITAKQPGAVTVSARYAGQIDRSTMNIAQVVRLTLTPENPLLRQYTQSALKLEGTYADGTTYDVSKEAKWHTNDANGMEVGWDGTLYVNSQSETLVHGSYGGRTALTRVHVYYIYDLEISHNGTKIRDRNMWSYYRIPMGKPVTLNATALFTNDSREDITTRGQWSSLNPEIATVSEAGIVTPVGPGQAILRLTLDGGIDVAIYIEVESR